MVSAIHGWWCNARTYPTVCRYCGRAVFYFSCDCGCKVFFDELGPPWPRHLCLPYLEATYGQAMATRLLEMHRLRAGEEISIEPEYAKTITDRQHNLVHPHRLIRQDPFSNGKIREIGYLREVGAPIDAYHAFGLPRSRFADALLGDSAERTYVRITLHTGDLSREDGNSYTGFVDATLFAASRAKRGDLVQFYLTTWEIPGCPAVWLCQRLAKIDLG